MVKILIKSIKMPKTYRTVSSEDLCVIIGMTPTHIKIEEVAELYHHTRSHIKDNENFDNNKEATNCEHAAEVIIRTPEGIVEDSPLHIYTDGTKTEKVVGSGLVTYR